MPPIFLAVAAFLLYIVISRMIQAEREQIGLMKAFGYSSLEVGAHYCKFILAIAAGGAVLGCLLGVAGRAQPGRSSTWPISSFPFLVFQVDPAAFVIGVVVEHAGRLGRRRVRAAPRLRADTGRRHAPAGAGRLQPRPPASAMC